MNQKSKLTFGKIFERFSYGYGDFGCNIIYTAMSAFLLFSVPASWASTPKLVYVFITYHLVSTVIYIYGHQRAIFRTECADDTGSL